MLYFLFNIYPKKKVFGTIFCNNHVSFPSRHHEKPAIFQDISKNIHEHFYEEIKPIRLEKFEEKIEKKILEYSLKFFVKNFHEFSKFSFNFFKNFLFFSGLFQEFTRRFPTN